MKLIRVVAGDISSTMIEATLAGRPVVQVILSTQGEIGVTDSIYAFTKNNKSGIEKSILNCVESKYIDLLNDYYIMRNNNFKKTLQGILMRL